MTSILSITSSWQMGDAGNCMHDLVGILAVKYSDVLLA